MARVMEGGMRDNVEMRLNVSEVFAPEHAVRLVLTMSTDPCLLFIFQIPRDGYDEFIRTKGLEVEFEKFSEMLSVLLKSCCERREVFSVLEQRSESASLVFKRKESCWESVLLTLTFQEGDDKEMIKHLLSLLEEEKNDLTTKTKDIQGLKAQLQRLNEALEIGEEKRVQLEASSRKELEETKQSLTEQLEQAKNDVMMLEEQLDTIKREKEKEKKERDEEFVRVKSQLEATIIQSTNKCSSLEKELSISKKKLEESDASNTERGGLVESLRNEIQSIRDDFSKTKLLLESERAKVIALNGQIEVLKTEVDVQRKAAKEAQEDSVKVRRELIEVKGAHARLEIALTHNGEEMKRLQTEADDLRNRLAQAEDEVQKHMTSSGEKERQSQQLSKDLSTAKVKMEEAEQKAKSAEDEVGRLREAVRTGAARERSLQEMLKTLQERVAELEVSQPQTQIPGQTMGWPQAPSHPASHIASTIPGLASSFGYQRQSMAMGKPPVGVAQSSIRPTQPTVPYQSGGSDSNIIPSINFKSQIGNQVQNTGAFRYEEYGMRNGESIVTRPASAPMNTFTSEKKGVENDALAGLSESTLQLLSPGFRQMLLGSVHNSSNNESISPDSATSEVGANFGISTGLNPINDVGRGRKRSESSDGVDIVAPFSQETLPLPLDLALENHESNNDNESDIHKVPETGVLRSDDLGNQSVHSEHDAQFQKQNRDTGMMQGYTSVSTLDNLLGDAMTNYENLLSDAAL